MADDITRLFLVDSGASEELRSHSGVTLRYCEMVRMLSELDLKLKSNQVVEVDQIGDHLDKIFSAVRQKLLGMPSKIAPLVQAEESIGGVRIEEGH